MKRKAGLLAALVLVLTLGPMWAFVLDEIKHERTLTVQAARNNASTPSPMIREESQQRDLAAREP